MNKRSDEISLDKALDVVLGILRTGRLPADTPDSLLANASFRRIVEDLTELQEFTMSISKGDLDRALCVKGFAAGALKQLQANLRHLTWQTQQVAAGDFEQRVDFMGQFSEAFNHMVVALADKRDGSHSEKPIC